jgi:predicted nucleotidyltransferase
MARRFVVGPDFRYAQATKMQPEIAARRTELGALCREHGVRRLELFGSAAAGTDRPGESDLDFLVELDDAPPQGYADAYFGLLESLQRLFGRPVDLVVGSAIRNPYFREAVERTKVLLYAA